MKTIYRDEFKIPIEYGYARTSDVLIKEIELYNKYDFDYDLMYDEGIITKETYIYEITYNFSIFYPYKKYRDYEILNKEAKTEYLVVLNEDWAKHIIVDTTKLNKNNKDRFTYKYTQWRNNVFERDKYTCKHCNKKGGKLNAHHIKSYKNYPSLRTNLENGITLCEKCHRIEHKRLRSKRYEQS